MDPAHRLSLYKPQLLYLEQEGKNHASLMRVVLRIIKKKGKIKLSELPAINTDDRDSMKPQLISPS